MLSDFLLASYIDIYLLLYNLDEKIAQCVPMVLFIASDRVELLQQLQIYKKYHIIIYVDIIMHFKPEFIFCFICFRNENFLVKDLYLKLISKFLL